MKHNKYKRYCEFLIRNMAVGPFGTNGRWILVVDRGRLEHLANLTPYRYGTSFEDVLEEAIKNEKLGAVQLFD